MIKKIPADKLKAALVKYLQDNDMSPDNLAKKLGVPRSTIWRWLNKSVRISYAMLRILRLEKIV